VRNWVARRNILGGSNTLLTELQVENRPGFMNYMWMSDGHFNIIIIINKYYFDKIIVCYRRNVLSILTWQVIKNQTVNICKNHIT
jgi:hypothetical protein